MKLLNIKELVIGAVSSLFLLSFQGEANATVVSSIPSTPEEYNNVFGFEPTESEILNIKRLEKEFAVKNVKFRSRADFNLFLQGNSPLLIMVGHNEKGEFKFTSGESLAIADMSNAIEQHEKLGVFLTCNGACYTDSPAPRLKTTLAEALVLAAQIQHRFANLKEQEPSSPSLLRNPDPIKPNFSSSKLTPLQCRQIVSSSVKSTRKTHAFAREVKRTIFRAERKKIFKGTATAAAALSTASLLVIVLEEE